MEKLLKRAVGDSEEEDDHQIEDDFRMETKKFLNKMLKAKRYPGEVDQEYDETLSELFEKVVPGEGDEFAAVKPWIGAIKEPKDHPKPNPKPPAQEFEIDWVYGYRNEESRMNMGFNTEGHAVYPTAALGVIFDYKNMSQVYFGGGKTAFSKRKQKDDTKNMHTDDVSALAISQSRQVVVSGQNGKAPTLMVWDAISGEMIAKKKVPKGGRLVTSCAVSPNDKYVAATDASEKIYAYIYSISGGANPIAEVEINYKVVHMAFSPHDDTIFATCGKDHVIVCDLEKDRINKKRGKAGGGKLSSQCAVAWVADPKFKNHMLSAGVDGQIYHWTGDTISKTYKNNKGAVHSITCKNDSAAGGEVVLVGGNDSSLTAYSFDGKLTKLFNVELSSVARSVDIFNGRLLLGLKSGCIVEMPYKEDGKGKMKEIMKSHCDGEVWGLDVVTLETGDTCILTSADDNKILAYNIKTKEAVAQGKVNAVSASKASSSSAKKKGARPKSRSKTRSKSAAVKSRRGGASTLSSEPPENQSRCIAYCESLQHLAVANNLGIVTIREVDLNAVLNKEEGALDTVKKTLFKQLKKAEWVEAMAYSPCSKFLVVGSHDNFIYLLDTNTYKKCTKLTGHSSFITAVDWSLDSTHIRTVCGAYELLFFNAKTKKRDPSGASNTVDTVWASQTCKFGWNVQGIFPSGCDGSHINNVAMTKDQKLIATGDDYGLVCVYRNPVLEGHDAGRYRGHSEHVTKVKFSDCGNYLFSVGGQDQTTIQWKKVK